MNCLVLYPDCARLTRGTEGSSPRGLIISLIIQTIQRDPSRSVRIEKSPNLSRPDPSGTDQIDAEHQATDLAVRQGCWPVPHLAVPFRSDTAAVADGAAAGCPAWPLPRCPHAPAAVVGVRSARGVRAPGVPQAASGVRASDSRYQPAAST
jgi:hypothetical protein